MCNFCENKEIIDTTIGDYGLKIRLDDENKKIMKVRLEYNTIGGQIGLTRPIKINYCFYCGEKLI